MGKAHVGRQDRSRNGRDQPKDEKQTSQPTMGLGGGAVLGAHKIQEVGRSGKNRNGSTNDVEKNLEGGILLGKRLVQMVVVKVRCIVGFIRVEDQIFRVLRFVAERIEGRNARCCDDVVVLCRDLPKEFPLEVGVVLVHEAIFARHTNGRAEVPHLEVPPISGTLISVVLEDSLEMPRVVQGNGHEDPDWDGFVGGKHRFRRRHHGIVVKRVL